MITREMALKKLLKQQLEIEIKTRDMYKKLIGELKNKELRGDLEFIMHQEEGHAELVKKLIRLLE